MLYMTGERDTPESIAADFLGSNQQAFADKIANQPAEMMQGGAPGRVDSQAGLGFLYEVSNIPLGPTAQSITQAVIGCYRAILDIVRMKWPQQKIVHVSLMDDA